MKYLFLLILFSSLILANDSMIETCKKVIKKGNANAEIIDSCNKLLKKENERLRNIKKSRIRIQRAKILDPGDETINYSFQYAFYKNISAGISIGQFYHSCQTETLDSKDCVEDDSNYERFYGDVYLSINFVDDYRYIRTGFNSGIGMYTARDSSFEPLFFVNFFFGLKIANTIDLTASIGALKLFSLELGINF